MTIRVADRGAGERFFDTVLAPLGIDNSYRTSRFTEWSNFGLAQATAQQPVTRRLHVAFVAPSREQVDKFWRAGVDAGYTDAGPPGLRPQYRKDYYGGFLHDPDGNSIEAVHHERPHRGDGAIDHLWLRVADFHAARRFYELAGTAVGFDLRGGDEHRAIFSTVDGEPSFSLVPGPPTENLHMAFSGDDEAVRRFYDDGIAAGYRGNGEPGERPRYHPGYYAAYLLDPDGNNIEVVNHHRD